MAIEGIISDPFEAFDREYEAQHAAAIALETWRVDWNNLTPQNAVAVITAANVWSVCRILQNLTWGNTR